MPRQATASTACECTPRPLPLELAQAEAPADPWQYRDERDDVLVFLRADLGTRWGQTIWREGVPEIYLAFDLSRIPRRCTLAHELIHAIRGAPCRPLCREDEAATVDATARWLLPDLEAVADHLVRYDVPDAAERLNVTRTVLTERLDALNDDEIEELGRLMHDLSPREDAVRDWAPRRTRRRAPA